MASWLLHWSSAPNIPTTMANETGVAKFNWQRSVLNSLDLLAMPLWHWHSHCLPCPQNLWGKISLLCFQVSPAHSGSLPAKSGWLLLTFFNEPNFLCSFWNLSSCLEFHPQDSKTLNQAVTILVFFPPLWKGPENKYFLFCRLHSPCPNHAEL